MLGALDGNIIDMAKFMDFITTGTQNWMHLFLASTKEGRLKMEKYSSPNIISNVLISHIDTFFEAIFMNTPHLVEFRDKLLGDRISIIIFRMIFSCNTDFIEIFGDKYLGDCKNTSVTSSLNLDEGDYWPNFLALFEESRGVWKDVFGDTLSYDEDTGSIIMKVPYFKPKYRGFDDIKVFLDQTNKNSLTNDQMFNKFCIDQLFYMAGDEFVQR